MSWRDNLQPGSFRGVGFEVLSASARKGRRQALFEFPQRDTPLVEDLGRRAPTFQVEAFVLGADYMAQRDALEAAIEAEGPGTLVHPYRGELQVCVLDHQTMESSAEGGYAAFSITFVEAGDAATPAVTADTAAAARSAASDLSSGSSATFSETFTTTGFPAFVPAAALSLLSTLAGAYAAAASLTTGAGAQLAAFATANAVLTSAGESLVANPPALASAVTAATMALASLTSTPAQMGLALLPLVTWGGDLAPVVATTPSRQQEATNQEALVILVRQAAAVAVVEAVAGEAFASYQDAVDRRDEVAEALDVAALEAADAGRDDVARAFTTLRLAMVRDVTARGGSLRRLYAYTPAQTQPALVIAHRLYDDAGREAEIVARNRIRRPGFTPGGQALEVLTNG